MVHVIFGAIAYLLKVTTSYVMSVRSSVRLSICLSVLMEQLETNCTDFYEISNLILFENLSTNFKFH